MGISIKFLTTALTLALMVFLMPSSHTEASRLVQQCSMPPVADIERQLSSPSDLHSTFYQFPALQSSVTTLERFEKVDKHMVNIKYSNINADSTSCNVRKDGGAVRDPCPVFWKFNHDENRVPETMVEAECRRCDHCRALSPEDFTMGCAPIRFYTKVLRRQRQCHPITGQYVYIKVWEPVTVGCACRAGVNVRVARDQSVKSG